MQLAMESDAPTPESNAFEADADKACWYCDATDVLFGARLFDSGALYRLTVERMGMAWDWTVWRPGCPFCVQSGVSASAVQAMRAAERAAEILEHPVAAT